MSSQSISKSEVKSCGFDIKDQSGQGSYGIIYSVIDANDNPYAFKYIKRENYHIYGSDELTEIDILSRIEHPHILHRIKIVTPYNCNIENVGIILPLGNNTLENYISSSNTSDKIKIIYKLASALDFMHENGILHLDIKNNNIIMIGTEPYFIDFGLSMLVDNAYIGEQSNRLRVTINHRPPELFINNNNIYNSAVDIWSFGILILYLFLGTNNNNVFNTYFYSHQKDNKAIHSYLIDKYDDKNHIKNLFSRFNINENIKNNLVDLISKMLKINPSQRISAKQILKHPLFNEQNLNITGFVITPIINTNYSSDNRNIVKLIIQWCRENKYIKHANINVLFGGIDLFKRVAHHYKDDNFNKNIIIASTCLFMTNKLLNFKHNIKIKDYIDFINLPNNHGDNITINDILNAEIEIITVSKGILYDSQIYKKSSNVNQLQQTLFDVILNQDQTIYGKLDIEKWNDILDNSIHNVNFTKNITIDEFFN